MRLGESDYGLIDIDPAVDICGPANGPVACAPNRGCLAYAPGYGPQLDTDGDGILDANDNCPRISNADQADADGDGVGNVCDNCVNTANPNQADNDNDSVGNACDTEGNDGDQCNDDIDNDGDGLTDCADPTCAANAAECEVVQCVVDADCAGGQACRAGTCIDATDMNGRTGVNQSGANAGPQGNGNPDRWDDDGDCVCDLDAAQLAGGMTCLGSVNLQCAQLLIGDCDDSVGGGAGNYPGATDWLLDGAGGTEFDNNCDGLRPDGSPLPL